ncbi:hypothetical protein ACFVYF_24460 [Streptomyces sp. NPDC058274]|uniref:hypothetical protein n=1 Tax=Streptomyces sp. NPDC058274 TaxID=3346416 RepID=UPI0036EE15F7
MSMVRPGLRVLELGTQVAFRDELTSLVLSGAKRATAGPAAEYRTRTEVVCLRFRLTG